MSRKTEKEKRSRLRANPPSRGIYATIYTLIVLLTIVCGLTITEVCSGWSAYSLIADSESAPTTLHALAPERNFFQLSSIVEQIEAAERGRALLQKEERKLSDRARRTY
jgi:hypothetical protein